MYTCVRLIDIIDHHGYRITLGAEISVPMALIFLFKKRDFPINSKKILIYSNEKGVAYMYVASCEAVCHVDGYFDLVMNQ